MLGDGTSPDRLLGKPGGAKELRMMDTTLKHLAYAYEACEKFTGTLGPWGRDFEQVIVEVYRSMTDMEQAMVDYFERDDEPVMLDDQLWRLATCCDEVMSALRRHDLLDPTVPS